MGKGSIWIRDDYGPLTQHAMRQIIYEAIEHTAPGQLRIVGFDENLTGLFAPFAALTEGQSRIIEFVDDRMQLKKQIAFLKQQVTAVQNVIRGIDGSLLEYRQRICRPVEQYQLIVLAMDVLMATQMDSQFRADIMRLFRVGPRAGISFLILGETPDQDTRLFYPTDYLSFVEFKGRLYNSRAPYEQASAIAKACERYLEAAKSKSTTNLETVPFTDLHPTQCWQKSSTDGLEFTIGRYGDKPQAIIIGDELNQRHNVLITGAVGQGKSNLISVIVHSLCWNYSPDELQLYLLDFKEGVTFKPYASIGQKTYLLHAKTIGLESDVEFGIAVFNDLHAEYLRRMRSFKSKNVRSLKEFRETYQNETLPRIVVVIDEFQLMFGTGQQATGVASMLENAVRLYRAAGIHFVLSSQSLDGGMQFNTRRDAIFGQVPIRIALKNSLSESYRTLSTDNPAAAYLRPREAIINEDYGAVHTTRRPQSPSRTRSF